MNVLIPIFLLNFIAPAPAAGPGVTSTDDELALAVVELFTDQLTRYTTEGYRTSVRLDIQEYLLTSESADFASDIPGIPYAQLPATEYLHYLKAVGVRVHFPGQPSLERCSDQPLIYGVTIPKRVRLENGEEIRYEDYIEVKVLSGVEARIRAVASNRYSSYNDITCLKPKAPDRVATTAPRPEKPTKPASQPTAKQRQKPSANKPNRSTRKAEESCLSFGEAESAARSGQTAEALALYEDALSCGYQTDYVQNQIDRLSTRQMIGGLLKEADRNYERGNYREAIAGYQLLIGNRYATVLNSAEKEHASSQLSRARSAQEFEFSKATGDYEFGRQVFTKAATAYRRARDLRPNDSYVRDRLAQAETFANGEYKRRALNEIADVVSRMERRRRYNDEASIVLMKYADTNWLTGQQLFYLIQLLDAAPGAVKKHYSLSQREICVKVKLLTRQATANGFATDDFVVFRKQHLNNRSRNCK